VPAMILAAWSMSLALRPGLLGLGDLTHLIPADLGDLGLVQLGRTLLNSGGLQQQPGRGRGLTAFGAVRRIQLKLHRWAGEYSARLDDFHNPVYHPAFLVHPYEGGREGARTPGFDRAAVEPHHLKKFGKPGRPQAGTGNTPDTDREQATGVKKSRWALLKNPDNLAENQTVTSQLIELRGPRPAPRLPAQGIAATALPDQGRRHGIGTGAVDRMGSPLPTLRVLRVAENLITHP